MLELARTRRLRDFLILSYLRWGLRVGEIVGHDRLPGLHVGNLRENTAWVLRKGGKEGWYAFPADLISSTKTYAKALRLGSDSKVFFLTERQGLNIVKGYARDTGIEKWNMVGCHRLRAFLATDARDQGLDAFTIRDAMDHSNITTTNTYVGKSTPSQMVTVVDRLARRQNS